MRGKRRVQFSVDLRVRHGGLRLVCLSLAISGRVDVGSGVVQFGRARWFGAVVRIDYFLRSDGRMCLRGLVERRALNPDSKPFQKLLWRQGQWSI